MSMTIEFTDEGAEILKMILIMYQEIYGDNEFFVNNLLRMLDNPMGNKPIQA